MECTRPVRDPIKQRQTWYEFGIMESSRNIIPVALELICVLSIHNIVGTGRGSGTPEAPLPRFCSAVLSSIELSLRLSPDLHYCSSLQLNYLSSNWSADLNTVFRVLCLK